MDIPDLVNMSVFFKYFLEISAVILLERRLLLLV